MGINLLQKQTKSQNCTLLLSKQTTLRMPNIELSSTNERKFHQKAYFFNYIIFLNYTIVIISTFYEYLIILSVIIIMDIIENCFKLINDQLIELDHFIDNQRATQPDDSEYIQTQNMIDVITSDKDKNLDRILDQQAHLKMIIDKDGRIVLLNKQIAQDMQAIENLRKSCAELEQKALRDRQELLETQAKEVSYTMIVLL